MQSVFYEVKGYIESFSEKNRENLIIFIGGDAEYFVNQIKNAIFAGRKVMYSGLNRILEYNAENERFYYVKALEGDANTAILMYYSNTDSSGNPTVSPSDKFMANNLGTNLSGTSNAVTYLPDTTKWPTVKLTTEKRQIYNELGGTTSASGNLSVIY